MPAEPKNIKIEWEEDNILVLRIDMSQDFGPSKSGKTKIIATSSGNIDIPNGEGAKLGLNIYRKL